MMRVYEFEIVKDGGYYLAFPFGMEGGTEGESLEEVYTMAADWLRMQMEHCIMHGLELPTATFGNKARRGGTVVVLGVDAGLESVRKMTGAEAARRLGVTPGRVSQMVSAGQLESFEVDGRTWVTADSVDARLTEAPHAGRPRKARA